MQVIKPSYYDEFHCLAGACPDSCCHEWAVVVDDASAARYRALEGELGQALRDTMQEEDGDIILTLRPDGRCPMWRDDGLCRIQAQLGESALCQTCSQFPRLHHDYGDFLELGLELSCPEAARLILTEDHSLCLAEVPDGDQPDYDAEAMAVLLESRDQALRLLSEYDPPLALALLLLYAHRVQAQLDGGDPAMLDRAASLEFLQNYTFTPGGDLLDFCKGLNILTQRWRERLERPQGSEWQDAHRRIAQYFVERYWLQAVSDGDLISRAKLVVFSCLVIKALGGDVVQTAQLYSKEIENDAENVDAILDGAYDSPALTDANLLHLLLEDTI